VGSNLQIARWISVRRQDPSSGAADEVVLEPWDGRRPRGLRVVTVDAGAFAVDIEVAARLRVVAGFAPGVVAGLAADLGFRPIAGFRPAAGLAADLGFRPAVGLATGFAAGDVLAPLRVAAGLAAAPALVLDRGLDPVAGLTAGRPVDRRVVLPAAVPCEAEVAGEAV